MADTDHPRRACAAILAAFLAAPFAFAKTEPRKASRSNLSTIAPSLVCVESKRLSGSADYRSAGLEPDVPGQLGESASSPPVSAAQVSPSNSVFGGVFDTSGGVVSDARVTLRSGNDAPEQSATSDSAGEFRFSGLAAGSYELQVEHAGFKIYKTEFKIGTRAPGRLRIVLEVAEHKETITVEGLEGPLSSDVARNADVFKLNSEFLENLPVLDGDVLGAISNLADPASVGSSGATVIIDGLPGSAVGMPASAIQEVTINNNPYSAEFARPGRGRIEIVTKSGSSKYHGSISFRFRDYRLDARNAFAVERPLEQRRQWEGYLSGPLGKGEKTTFLISASRKEEDLQSVVNALGLSGPIRENSATPKQGTYFSTQFTHQFGKGAFSLRYALFDWLDKSEGVGGFILPEVAADSNSRYHQLYSSYRSVITTKLLNEFLIRFKTENGSTVSRHPDIPRVVVLDAFTGGGAQADRSETENRVDFTDMLSWAHGRHLVKMGVSLPVLGRQASDDQRNFQGTFYFSSLEDLRQGRPFSFVRQQGDGHLVFWQAELGSFIQDDVRIRPNFSMGLGLRYDWQNYLSDHHNFAPRLAFAFAPGKARKTVLRGGAGFFYDTTGPEPIADALRLNGVRLRQYVLSNPGFPDPLALGGSFAVLPTSVARFAPDLSSPYIAQYSFGVERQLRNSLTLTATYIGTRGIKLFRSRDINAPPPPLYLSRPDASVGILRQIESSGHQESHAVEVAVRGNLTRFFSGIVEYRAGRSYDDTDGIRFFPANNYDLSTEWSRSSFDQRHSFLLYGTLNPGRFFKLGIGFSARSGRPYSLTTGRDDNRDGFANDRPPRVRRNSLEAPGSATLDMRWSKQFLLNGSKKKKEKEKGPSATFAVDVFNILNRVNFGKPVGNLSSPFFGQPVSAGPARRVQLSLSFKF